jgi:RNA polymerase sigma factor (sigma-70 family)
VTVAVTTELQRWFAAHILPHEARLRRHLRGIRQRPSDVDDLVQETFSRMVSMPADARGAIRSPYPFLLTTARRVLIDRIRRHRVVAIDSVAGFDDNLFVDPAPTALEQYSAAEELELLKLAIASLPVRCREVLELRKIQGLSQREIAVRLAIAESTVEKHVAHGVRLCAQFFREALMDGPSHTRAAAITDANAR